ncbi:MAG: SdrD B-like domain-containing protein [Bacteroidota bacterium]
MVFNRHPMIQGIFRTAVSAACRWISIGKWIIVIPFFCLTGSVATAQHDVALEKVVDRDSVAIGDTVTFTIRVYNQNGTNVAGLQVRDTLTVGLTYLDHEAPAGTIYNTTNGVWMIGNALTANTPELELTIRTRVEWEGMYMNIAEVIEMAGSDEDSTPDNEELLEDDMDKACVSVPITFCTRLHDSVRVTLLPMFTNIQWYKDGIFIPANEGGNQDTFYITSAGIYSFTAEQNGCPTLTCCPVIVKDSCYDLALRKTLATGQDDLVAIGSEVNYTLEITNQGDLPATGLTILDDVDVSVFAPFSTALNPAGMTTGSVPIPYVWLPDGADGKLTINGTLMPGQTIFVPVTLTVINAGEALNFAEIFSDDDRDADSQPESQENDGNADMLVDDEINNLNGDEDDHDVASVEVLSSGIGDFVWFDNDHDGQQDPDEPGVEGVVVQLFDADDNLIGTDTTDMDGHYFFDNLPPGDYYLIFDIGTLPPNYVPSPQNQGNDDGDSDADVAGRTPTITLSLGEIDTSTDFGIDPLPSSLGDFVWEDLNQNGQQDPGEPGVEGVTVILLTPGPDGLPGTPDDVIVGSDETDSNGEYGFTGLSPDDYFLFFDPNTFPTNYVTTTLNTGNDATDSDAGPDGYTDLIDLGAGVDRTDIDLGVFESMFDLALEKMLTPGQPAVVDIGDEVSYQIKITNEGGTTASDIAIIDLIPAGLAFSPNNTGWTLISSDSAEIIMAGPLMPGQSDSVEIKLIVIYGASGASLVNIAEIESASDSNGVQVFDVDSTPNNGNPTEDDLDTEEIELLAHDPTGWIYCEKTGKIITGGTITVIGPNGIPNDEVVIVHDGSSGFYEFYAVGTAGVYNLFYDGFPISPDCPDLAGPFDPSGMPSPIILGADTLNSEYLADASCAVNPYYMSFDLELGDPPIFLNNIPVECIFIGSIVCEDSNNNDVADPTDNPVAGATVYLYNCADLVNPIDSTLTNALGEYRFDGLEPGDYTVGFNIEDGLRPISTGVFDANGFSPCLSLDWGECDTTSLICLYDCPEVDAGPDLGHCDATVTSQLNAVVSHGSGTYLWSPATGLSDPTTANPFANPATTTTYFVAFDDGLGCTDFDSLTINVGASAPFVNNDPFTNATVECADDAPFEAPVFLDNCDPDLDIVYDSVFVNNACGYTVTRTWTATNDSGSMTTFTQTVVVSDTTPPSIVTSNPAINGLSHGDTLYRECNQIISLTAGDATAVDNCDPAPSIEFTEFVSAGDCLSDGYLQIMTCGWVATDSCGNMDSLFITIVIIDNTPPQLTGVPADESLSCEMMPAAPPTVTAFDNCANNIVVQFSEMTLPDGCADQIIRTWSATDNCGNATTATQTITFTDDEAPVISGVPSDETHECEWIEIVATPITVTDNCTVNPALSVSLDTNFMACGYEITRTWTAVDDCGNTASESQIITVTDVTSPILAGVPADLTLNCGETIPAPPIVTGSDNCDGNITVDFTEITNGSGCSYSITRMWTATDLCGNTTVGTQQIQVTDDGIPPSILNVPSDVNAACGDLPEVPNNISATDNCDAAPTLVFNETTTGSGCNLTVTRTWTATDDCGNSSVATQIINVSDMQEPVLSGLPADLTLGCNDVVTPPAVVTATDDCLGDVPVDFVELTNSVEPCTTIVNRIYAATDSCGNQAAHHQHIYLIDQAPPVLTINHPQLGNAQQGDTLIFDCDSVPVLEPFHASATDDCSTAIQINTIETILEQSDCSQSGYLLLMQCGWEAIDECGNTSEFYVFFRVVDTEAPVIISGVPADVTVECGAVPPATANIVATDNCDDTLDISSVDVIIGSGCNYTIERTWMVSDDCGRTATALQTIFVYENDLEAPVAVEPADLTVSCGNIPAPETPVFTDNCDDSLTVVFFEIVDNNGCGQEIKRVWSATDRCGNSTTVDQIINVIDDVPPTVQFNHPWLIGLMDGDTLTMSCENPEIFGEIDATAVDDCSDASIDFTENGITLGDCSNDGFIAIMHCTWTATDSCGNSSSTTIYMRIVDDMPPVISNVPANVTVSCGEPIPDCGNPEITDACGDVTFELTTSDVPTSNGFTRICTWIATDECGNISTAIRTIFVEEGGLPVFSEIPADTIIIYANNETVPPPADVTAVDGCTGEDLIVVFSETIIPDPNGCDTTIIREWSTTDNNGNSMSQEQTITVLGSIVASVGTTTPDTCELSVGSAVLLPSDATYEWSDGGTGASRNDLLAGTYTVTVNGGICANELTVLIGNIQNPTQITAATSPEICGNMNGAAILSPSNYTYDWSDGGTGAERVDLIAGAYAVTVTNGGCSSIITINIGSECDCEPAVVNAINTTTAGCGESNGTAQIDLEGDEADYQFVWVPNLGTANQIGNERTGLPAQHYVVFVTYQNNPDCIEKIEFDVSDDCFRCGPIFEIDAMTVETFDEVTKVCLPVPFGVSSSADIDVNDDVYDLGIEACDEDSVNIYNYSALPTGGEEGMFSVAWELGKDTLYTIVYDMDELATIMTQLDTIGTWYNSYDDRYLLTKNMKGEYGRISIAHVPSNMVLTREVEETAVMMGTRLLLEEGLNEVVYINPANDCSDTITVTVDQIGIVYNPPTILHNDTLKTIVGKSVTANLMANDRLGGEVECMEIVLGPQNGIVTVDESYQATYRPFDEFCVEKGMPLDKFFYEICMDDGETYTAVAYVDVACREDVLLFPNPADRYVNIDLAPMAGQPVDIQIIDNFGIVVERIHVGEATTVPLRLNLNDYRSGHYAVWIFTPRKRLIIRQLIITRL